MHWKQRGKPSNAGVDTWTYWYNGDAKRWVGAAARQRHHRRASRLQNERWELESYRVK